MMTRSTRRTASLAIFPVALAALLACGELPIVPANSGPQPRLTLSVWLLDIGDTIPVYWLGGGRSSDAGRVVPAPGLIVLSGTFWPGEVKGRLRRVTVGTLRVNGTTSLGTRSADGSLQFIVELPMARSADSVTLELPEVEGVRAGYPTLRLRSATHAAGETARLAAGELRLPIAPPTSASVPSPSSQRWTVGVRRNTQSARVDGTTELPSEMVVPVGSLLPGEGAVDVRLSQEAYLYGPRETASNDTTYSFTVRFSSTLLWPAVMPGASQ